MELIRHIENRITDDGFSPAATIGEIKVKGMQFSTQMIYIKTLYNMIDRGGFYRIWRPVPEKIARIENCKRYGNAD